MIKNIIKFIIVSLVLVGCNENNDVEKIKKENIEQGENISLLNKEVVEILNTNNNYKESIDILNDKINTNEENIKELTNEIKEIKNNIDSLNNNINNNINNNKRIKNIKFKYITDNGETIEEEKYLYDTELEMFVEKCGIDDDKEEKLENCYNINITNSINKIYYRPAYFRQLINPGDFYKDEKCLTPDYTIYDQYWYSELEKDQIINMYRNKNQNVYNIFERKEDDIVNIGYYYIEDSICEHSDISFYRKSGTKCIKNENYGSRVCKIPENIYKNKKELRLEDLEKVNVNFVVED